MDKQQIIDEIRALRNKIDERTMGRSNRSLSMVLTKLDEAALWGEENKRVEQ